MKKIFFIIPILLIFNTLDAQEIDTIVQKDLQEVVVLAQKPHVSVSQSAAKIISFKNRSIIEYNAQSTADLLAASGLAFVQKSQQGGGSPILRGFEASRVLLVVDGVRMNNLIFRAGHLQNIITLDQSILDHVDVLFGPNSTVYGSDALGGVMSFYTKNPIFPRENAFNSSGNAFVRFGSVNQEKTGHLDFNLGWKNFASLSSITFSDFGNLRMGKNAQTLDTVWGLRRFTAQRINGNDSLVANDDPYLQKDNAFQQYDILQKLMYKPNNRVSHLINVHFSNSTNVPRYDRLTDPKGNGLNSAEWYYGPQKRLLAAYELKNDSLQSFFNSGRINLNYQSVEESRHNRNFGAEFKNSRIENVTVWGANIDFQKKEDKHDLRIGLDFQTSSVKSTAFKTSKIDGKIGTQSTRYPDGDNTQASAATYLTHTWKITEGVTLNDGFRLGYTSQKSTFVSQEFYKFPFSETVQNVFGASGNVGLMYNPSKTLKLSLLGSTGYRVPNVDDLSKIFDTQKGKVVVPNAEIKTEKTYNLDFGIGFNLDKNAGKSLYWDNHFYLTSFRDAIVVDKFQYNGQDSILYDGVKSGVFAPQNKQNALIYGFSSRLIAVFTEGLTADFSLNYTKGRVQNANDTETPLDHIPPVFGRLGVRYADAKWSAEFFVNYNGWKRIDDYLLNAEDNESYATKAGMPAWWTMNLHTLYNVSKNFTVQLGIDNIADINYRTFASGIHAGGRNLFACARVRF